jgi:hypothetical protein
MPKLRSLTDLRKVWPALQRGINHMQRLQVDELVGLRADIQAQLAIHQSRVAELTSALGVANVLIDEKNNEAFAITDHAVLRYLERMHRLNTNEVRDSMRGLLHYSNISEDAAAMTRPGKPCMYRDHHATGLRFVLQGSRVVTCFKKGDADEE